MQESMERKGDWVTYRQDIKVLDCTIRDGGLMNKHLFTDDFVRGVYDACVASGVHYMELGYKNSKKLFQKGDNGDWRFCDEDDMRRLVGENDTPLKLSAMADAEKCDYKTDILPKDQSVLDLIRVACYIHQIPLALDMIKDAVDKGYETTINLMAVSTVQERELDQALEVLCQTPVKSIYLVDSFGAYYSEQIQHLTRKYLTFARPNGLEVGIHAHNNQQLGFANTIESLILGTSWIDATIGGLGRGAGNCPMELLLSFLHNPRFHLRPILECLQNHVNPLKKEVTWGYDIAYLLTGHLNQHPRAAMKFMESGDTEDIVGFYDQLMADYS